MKLNKMEAEYFWQAILDHIHAEIALANKDQSEDFTVDEELEKLRKECSETRDRLCNQFAENTGWKPRLVNDYAWQLKQVWTLEEVDAIWIKILIGCQYDSAEQPPQEIFDRFTKKFGYRPRFDKVKSMWLMGKEPE